MADDNASGWGRLLLDRAKYHDDLRLLHMAIKQRWEIDEEFKAIALARLRSIVETGDDDIALKAIDKAIAMTSQNQKDEHKKLDEFSQLVINIATRTGIDLSAITGGQATQGDPSEGDE